MKPVAKKNGILREDVAGETLLYDQDRHRVHCLNPLATFVWEHADGTRDLESLARFAAETLQEDTNEEVMALAVERLARARLLEGAPVSREEKGVDRRETLRRLARMGLVLPVVMTLVSPTPTQAATRITARDCWYNPSENEGKCCTNGRECRRFGRIGLCWGPPC